MPHTVRLLAGASYRVILPLSLLFGGAFLVLADLVARTVAGPAEMPIGVVTAFVGAPFFVLVLRTARRVRDVTATPPVDASRRPAAGRRSGGARDPARRRPRPSPPASGSP